MLVRDIMTRAVKTAHPDAKVGDIAIVMCFNKISGMPVVDDAGHIVGIISEKDILHAMFPNLSELMQSERVPDFEALEQSYRDVVSLHVKDVMKQRVATVEPDMPVLKAASIMFVRQFRRIPVAEGRRLVGIISIGDVHKAIFQETFGTGG
jgi:CBS domain-containing protein